MLALLLSFTFGSVAGLVIYNFFPEEEASGALLYQWFFFVCDSWLQWRTAAYAHMQVQLGFPLFTLFYATAFTIVHTVSFFQRHKGGYLYDFYLPYLVFNVAAVGWSKSCSQPQMCDVWFSTGAQPSVCVVVAPHLSFAAVLTVGNFTFPPGVSVLIAWQFVLQLDTREKFRAETTETGTNIIVEDVDEEDPLSGRSQLPTMPCSSRFQPHEIEAYER